MSVNKNTLQRISARLRVIMSDDELDEGYSAVLREGIIEAVAGFTDSIATQVYVLICWYIYQIAWVPNYFQSPKHIYWIFYFLNMNIFGPMIWGKTWRNSLSYAYSKGSTQSMVHTLIVIFIQYISIFGGLYISIAFIEYFYAEQTAETLKYLLAGQPNGASYSSDIQTVSLFIAQSITFQLLDRLIGVTMTSLSGKWIQATYRCLVMHHIIVNQRMFVILNPNFGLYSSLYYWRWNMYDFIVLILPWIVLFIWNNTFSKITFSKKTN